jgi:hypothetical protein
MGEALRRRYRCNIRALPEAQLTGEAAKIAPREPAPLDQAIAMPT